MTSRQMLHSVHTYAKQAINNVVWDQTFILLSFLLLVTQYSIYVMYLDTLCICVTNDFNCKIIYYYFTVQLFNASS